MVFDSLKLCLLIENYPCLYDYNLPEYCRKDVLEKAWTEISLVMNESGKISRDYLIFRYFHLELVILDLCVFYTEN